MENASNKLWCARVGACGALAEVIAGRTWNELGRGGPILDDDDIFMKIVYVKYDNSSTTSSALEGSHESSR
jgi:hypothetical protein